MRTYRGNETVLPGYYLNRSQLNVETVSQPGALPGPADVAYYRLPVLAIIALAPLVGLAYVIFLPLVGFAMVVRELFLLASHKLAATARAFAHVLAPAWQPRLAFLSRGKAARNHEPAEDAWARQARQKLEAHEDDKKEKH